MGLYKCHYFTIYKFLLKLLLLSVLTFLTVNCETKPAKQFFAQDNQFLVSENALNVNIESVDKLEKLPGVGAKTAREIVNHRETFGRFRKPEHLMLVRGISDARFRKMRSLIKVE